LASISDNDSFGRFFSVLDLDALFLLALFLLALLRLALFLLALFLLALLRLALFLLALALLRDADVLLRVIMNINIYLLHIFIVSMEGLKFYIFQHGFYFR